MNTLQSQLTENKLVKDVSQITLLELPSSVSQIYSYIFHLYHSSPHLLKALFYHCLIFRRNSINSRMMQRSSNWSALCSCRRTSMRRRAPFPLASISSPRSSRLLATRFRNVKSTRTRNALHLSPLNRNSSPLFSRQLPPGKQSTLTPTSSRSFFFVACQNLLRCQWINSSAYQALGKGFPLATLLAR